MRTSTHTHTHSHTCLPATHNMSTIENVFVRTTECVCENNCVCMCMCVYACAREPAHHGRDFAVLADGADGAAQRALLGGGIGYMAGARA